MLPVADVERAAAFYRDRLGFRIDFLHGSPPSYGAVSRDGARLHLKFVHEPVLDIDAAPREGLVRSRIDCSAHPMISPPRLIPRASAEIM